MANFISRDTSATSNPAELHVFIKSGNKEKEDIALKQLYFNHISYFNEWAEREAPSLKEHVSEVLQLSTILYFKFVIDDRITEQSPQNTFTELVFYLFTLKYPKKTGKITVDKSVLAQFADSSLLRFMEEQNHDWVNEIWKLNSDACQDVMKLTVFYRYPIREIVKEMGYKSSQMARSRHFQCLEGLKRAISQKPQFESLFRKLLSGRE